MNELIKSELNPNQQEAVLCIDAPSLVIAGAGSGKTRVLTYKIAYLLSQGYPPESILALTFTNKAAREMKERIAQMIGWQEARRLYMGTFHSIFSRILRNEAERLGFTSQFTIYDSSDSKSLLKAIVREFGLDDKIYKASAVHSRISYAKNNLLSPKAYRGNADLMKADFQAKTPQMVDIYERYAARCKAANAMDFDDLLYFTNVLFRDFPDRLAVYQDFFRFILVDEYQDTNFSQYLIIKRLAEKHHRLCVVGDDAQSIYSFRGANIDNILNFRNAYPECRLFKLEQNYRSTKTIVNAANSLIAKNKGQIHKNVFSQKNEGEKIRVHSVFSDFDEAFTVAKTIADIRETNSESYNEFAVLYRTNAQSRVLEEALRKRAIPYRIYGGLSFYQRKEIKDVIAYFRLVINPNDEEALKRIINVPARGIGDTTLHKILECSHLRGVSTWEVLSKPMYFGLNINAGTASKLEKFRQLIQPFHEALEELNAYEIGVKIVKMSGLMGEDLLDNSAETLSQRDNIEELLKAMHEFCVLREEEEGTVAHLPDFLAEVSLLTDQDTKEEHDEQRVTLMTVHASKGLEFNHVFVVGLEEELFPSSRMQTERDLEEERRLFYVAITRARQTCHISHAKSRFRNGKTAFSTPSRFIKDIDPHYLDMPDENTFFTSERREFNSFNPFVGREKLKTSPVSTAYSPKKLTRISAVSNKNTVSQTADGLYVGARVTHKLFGIGNITELQADNAANVRAVVDFDNVGEKSLLLKFAKLELVNKTATGEANNIPF